MGLRRCQRAHHRRASRPHGWTRGHSRPWPSPCWRVRARSGWPPGGWHDASRSRWPGSSMPPSNWQAPDPIPLLRATAAASCRSWPVTSTTWRCRCELIDARTTLFVQACRTICEPAGAHAPGTGDADPAARAPPDREARARHREMNAAIGAVARSGTRAGPGAMPTSTWRCGCGAAPRPRPQRRSGRDRRSKCAAGWPAPAHCRWPRSDGVVDNPAGQRAGACAGPRAARPSLEQRRRRADGAPAVLDRGPGIPADQLDAMWRPFERLDALDGGPPGAHAPAGLASCSGSPEPKAGRQRWARDSGTWWHRQGSRGWHAGPVPAMQGAVVRPHAATHAGRRRVPACRPRRCRPSPGYTFGIAGRGGDARRGWRR